VGYYSERRYYANDFHKPPIDKMSPSFFYEYFKESLLKKDMNSELFWGDDIYGGTIYSSFKQFDANIKTAKYLVLTYRIKNLDYEKKLGELYIYNLEDN